MEEAGKIQGITYPGGRIFLPSKDQIGKPMDPGSILIARGSAMALLPNLEEYIQYGEDGQRQMVRGQDISSLYQDLTPEQRSVDYATALEWRLRKAQRAGKIATKGVSTLGNEKGKFHDLLFRISEIYDVGGRKNVEIAPTSYHEMIATNRRAAVDEKFRQYLIEKGIKDFNDPRAYFSDAAGVTCFPISNQGDLIVVKRSEKMRILPGCWHGIAGYTDAHALDSLLIPTPKKTMHPIMRNFQYEVMKEPEEEGDLHPEEISDIAFLGITFGDLVNYDMEYRIFYDLTTKKILERMKHAKEGSDNPEKKVIDGVDELVNFLTSENVFVPQTIGGLLLHLAIEDRAAYDYVLRKYKEWQAN